jgi:hypothetical protein
VCDLHLEGRKTMLEVSVREVFQGVLKTKVAPVFQPERTCTLAWIAMIGFAGELPGGTHVALRGTLRHSECLENAGDADRRPNEECKDALREPSDMIASNLKQPI